MRAPSDDVARFWGLASESIPLGASVLARCQTAPGLLLSNYLHSVRPSNADELRHDLDRAIELTERVRILIEKDTPPWIEAELLLHGWHTEQEYRLVLPADRRITELPASIEIRPAAEADPDWSERAAMFRMDHLEEDARHGTGPRPQGVTDATIGHRQALEEYASYFCVVDRGATAGFVCCWSTPEARGVIEDLYVHPDHRGGRLATALIGNVVATLRGGGIGAITIAAEVGDTPVQLYARLGFRPTAVVRSYVRP